MATAPGMTVVEDPPRSSLGRLSRRLDLAANRLDEAAKEAGEALRLDPESRAAQELRTAIEAKSGKH